MAGDLPFSMVGNLVDDPELRYTPSGTAVANVRVATNPSHFDKQSNQWVDDEPVFMSGNIWREQAENATNSLRKGDRVFLSGKLRQRSYETREGQHRTVYEVEVDDIGPSMKYATAQVTRTPRQSGDGKSYGGGGRSTAPSGGAGGSGGFNAEPSEPPF